MIMFILENVQMYGKEQILTSQRNGFEREFYGACMIKAVILWVANGEQIFLVAGWGQVKRGVNLSEEISTLTFPW